MANHIDAVSVRGIDVVPIIGAMGMIETGIHPNGIAQAFARALGGDSYLVNAGGVCVINFLVLDKDGKVIDHPIAQRIINLPLEQLRRVHHVVVVASGQEKVGPIRVALKSGLVTTLVSDVETAQALMA